MTTFGAHFWIDYAIDERGLAEASASVRALVRFADRHVIAGAVEGFDEFVVARVLHQMVGEGSVSPLRLTSSPR